MVSMISSWPHAQRIATSIIIATFYFIDLCFVPGTLHAHSYVTHPPHKIFKGEKLSILIWSLGCLQGVSTQKLVMKGLWHTPASPLLQGSPSRGG